MSVKFAHGRINTEPTQAEQIERAEHSDFLFGRVNPVSVAKAVKPGILQCEYARITVETTWTDSIRKMGGGSIPLGCRALMDNTGADGLLVDTPFEGADPWANVKLIDEIRAAIAPRFVMPNFGDADTWAGRTSPAKALAAITDWHLVEVFIDINRYSIVQFASLVDAVTRALAYGKHLVLGVYDNGAVNGEKAKSVMQNWENRVYWSYKISPTEWGFMT